MSDKKSDYGLIGLAVMGQNLVLNVESRGFQVSVYNRTTATTDEFIAKHPGKKLVGAKTLEEFVQSLATPTAAITNVRFMAVPPLFGLTPRRVLSGAASNPVPVPIVSSSFMCCPPSTA